MSDKIQSLSGFDYISLETFRKNGNGVKTPVWFVTKDDKLYVITKNSTGKVKRLANNSKINLAPCSFKGDVKGEWISGNALQVAEQEAQSALDLRKKKYGIKARLVGFMTMSRGKIVAYSITLD